MRFKGEVTKSGELPRLAEQNGQKRHIFLCFLIPSRGHCLRSRVGHAPARYARLRVTYPAGVSTT